MDTLTLLTDNDVLMNEMVELTGELTGFSNRRGELHMSALWKSREELVHEFLNGVNSKENDALKLYAGKVVEAAMVERLKRIYNRPSMMWNDGKELSAYGGNLTGHTDGDVNGDVLFEIKTVPNDEILRRIVRTGLGYKVIAQVQSYMHWGGYIKGMVIYESRESGNFWITDVAPDATMQKELSNKAFEVMSDARVIAMINEKKKSNGSV